MIGVGDKVICVNAGEVRVGGHLLARPNDLLSEGRCYTVISTFVDEYDGLEVLHIAELRSKDLVSGGAFAATRFRKIRPDEHEACEDEFIILLKLSKQRVSA